jgi:hypothetical protein
MLMQDKAFRPGTFSYTRGKLIKGYLMMALNNQRTLDCRVGELPELPRHVKATHLRGFHVD